jgi:hypothetical protein
LQENYNAFLQGVGYWELDLSCREKKKKKSQNKKKVQESGKLSSVLSSNTAILGAATSQTVENRRSRAV